MNIPGALFFIKEAVALISGTALEHAGDGRVVIIKTISTITGAQVQIVITAEITTIPKQKKEVGWKKTVTLPSFRRSTRPSQEQSSQESTP